MPDPRAAGRYLRFDRGGAPDRGRELLQMHDLDRSFPKEQLSEVWSHLGLAFQNNHDTKKAMIAYRSARELNPENLQAWFNGGMIQHEEGMLHPALQELPARDRARPRSNPRSGAISARCSSSSANSSTRSIRSIAPSASSPTTRARGTISPARFARSTSSTRRSGAVIAR